MLDTGNDLILSVETDRVINLNSSRYFLGVEGDKEVKIIRFQLDRYYCGIDLSVFKPRVNYKLSNSKEYYGEATIADFDEDYIYVEWTLDPSVTSVKGRVDFLVQLTKLDEEGSILKRYNSTMAMGRVEEGLNPEDQLPESMKKDILAIAEDALTQLKESKTEFDNRLKIISDEQNKIIVRLDATDLKINNFDEDYETKMNDFHADYQEKMESFKTDYSEKMKSAIKNIEDTSVQSVTNVENAKDEVLQNIQNKSTEFLNNIDEAENKAIKNIENSGEHYQEQINTLQQESAQQDEVLDKLNEEVDLKLTQPYLNNNDSTHITSSDNGSLKNIVVKGNTVQNSTKGLNLLSIYKQTQTVNGITLTYDNDNKVLVANGTANAWLNISLGTFDFKKGVTYKFVGCPKGGSVDMLYHIEPNGGLFFDIGNGVTYMPSEDKLNVAIYFVVCKGVVLNNLVIKPMITTDLNATYDTYEPYTGGQPSPSPEYPQEIKAVNELSGVMSGKNLLKPYGSYPKINYGITLSLMNDGIHVNGKCTGSSWHAFIYSDTLQAGTYYINGIKGASNSRYQVVLYKNSAILNYITTDNFKLELKEKAKIELSLFVYSGYGTFNDLVLPYMICRNENDLYLYTPYQGQSLLNYTLQNPLYKLGDIYDYIDLNRGKIVRNIGVITFDGSDDEYYWKSNDYENVNGIKLPGLKDGSFCLCDKLVSPNNWSDFISNNQTIYAGENYFYIKSSDLVDVSSLKSFLTQNPITVVYQLATPVEEPLPSDLQTLLQSLKTYYPQTNIMFDTEVEPYINFDYKLNLKSWIEDKDNKEIEYDKSVNDIQPYSDSYIEKWFNLMRTGRVYTVKFPLWETSQSPIVEKLDANRGLICEPSTPVYAGQNDYDEIPVFKTFDVNAYVDNDGEVHLTAFKGDENFQDTGKVDVFVLTMSYYEKTWTEDGYWYYSISDSPKPSYTIAKECLKKDGSIRPYALYAKYVAGAIDGQPYSSKGLIPCYYPFEAISAYHMVSYCKQRGKYYTGGLMWDYKYIWTRFMLKFANTNSQAVLGGAFGYSFQYPITIAEENVKRAIVSKSNAARYAVGSCVSIGDWGDATSMDRSNKNCHNIARNVKILSIEDIDDSNSSLNLDLAEPITTTTTCRVTTMHYLSGYSDEILGRDGSLGTDPKSTKHPIVISGIECAVGGYEIPCNAMMNILNASGDREVYITHDATKLSTNTQTIMNTWKKSGMTIKTSKVNNWQYITKMGIDTELGCVLPLAAGESGSASSTGFGDGLYCDNAATGQREFLLLGYLGAGSLGGLSCLRAADGFSNTRWTCLARISIMAVRGE